MNLRELMLRAKEENVTASEIQSVASELRRSTSRRDRYRLIYILGRTGRREHEDLIAQFLEYPEDPSSAGLAVHILCTQWGLARKYHAQLMNALSGYPWDEDNETRVAALSATGEFLRTNADCALLAKLIVIAEADKDVMQSFAVDALERALGDSDNPSTQTGTVINQARARHTAECSSA